LNPYASAAHGYWWADAITFATVTLWVVLPFAAVLPVGPTSPEAGFVGGNATGFLVVAAQVALLIGALLSHNGPSLALIVLLIVESMVAMAFAATLGLDMPRWILSFYVLTPVVYAIVTSVSPELRHATLGWLRAGNLDTRSWKSVGAVVAVMYSVTIPWAWLSHADLTHQPLMNHSWGMFRLVLCGVGVALVNAGAEEMVYRGVLMSALDEALGPVALVILIQAIAFGAFHFNSTEPGLLGVLGTAIFGAMLGWLKRQSDGMLAPYMAHFAVDILIWTIGMVELASR
jgi:membrane protease YdiL (CAAX protease family)